MPKTNVGKFSNEEHALKAKAKEIFMSMRVPRIKDIANVVGVAPSTVGRWRDKDGWLIERDRRGKEYQDKIFRETGHPVEFLKLSLEANRALIAIAKNQIDARKDTSLLSTRQLRDLSSVIKDGYQMEKDILKLLSSWQSN